MENLSYTLTLTAPIFILIALGFFSVKLGWLAKESTRSLGWFVANIGIPATILKALSSRDLEEILRYDYLFVYGMGSLAAFATLFAMARIREKGLTEASIIGLGVGISNSVMMGYPIMTRLLGEAALVPFALTLMVENMLVLPLALALAETGQKKHMPFTQALFGSFLQLLKNPILLAIMLGIMFASLGIRLPSVAATVVDMLSASVGALALFSVGAMLVGLKSQGMLSDLSLIVIGKLLLHPLAVIGLIMVVPSMPLQFQSAAVIIACMPMFSIYPVLGAKYNLGGFCSAALLPTTIISFITINVFLLFWGIK